jgi:hypothetical protein
VDDQGEEGAVQDEDDQVREGVVRQAYQDGEQ